MPVIAKFCGIVMRLLIDRTFGTHVHAFYGDLELMISLNAFCLRRILLSSDLSMV